MMIFSKKWSISKAKQKIAALESVYDVMVEVPSEERYLIHVWVANQSEKLKKRLTKALKGRPPDLKVDILLYPNG